MWEQLSWPKDKHRFIPFLAITLSYFFRYNRAQRNSKVSSVNTEASITEDTSKYQEENEDTLGLFM